MTLDDAALILGCARSTVRRLIAAGELPPTDRYRHRQLARADVEALALRVYRWRLHLDDVDPYWVTGERAAVVLGVGVTRLNQLAARGFVPFETHAGTGRGCIGGSNSKWSPRRGKLDGIDGNVPPSQEKNRRPELPLRGGARIGRVRRRLSVGA
ncbi:MAG: helix-turn-helix domain-containing protein [Propionibacteriales bacterium]|nr:helix-turn-helix domain-containing protein [Propionibacteriales bacterium]